MKILIASNTYKNFASSMQINRLIKKGIQRTYPNWFINILPVADGGEGTVDSIILTSNGEYRSVEAFSPLYQPIRINVGYLPTIQTAFLEVSDTAGAGQVCKDHWNTLHLSSFGVGIAIRKVAQMDVQHIVIGLGGSIISDGGLGMAQALGAKFYNRSNQFVKPQNGHCMTCLDLMHVDKIDVTEIPSFIRDKKYTILSDVDIKLLGPHGQAYTFGLQKKATREDVAFIESALTNWNRALEGTFNETFDIPLAGAAGGLGAGLKAFLRGKIKLGIDFVLDYISFNTRCQAHDLVITGEGCLDKTTSLKKACYGIAKRCQKLKKPYYGIFGYIKEPIKEFLDCSIDASINGLNMNKERKLFSKGAVIEAASLLCNKIGKHGYTIF